VVNVVGNQVEEFATVVSMLDDSPGVSGYELNVSCPNVKAGGMEFGADLQSLTEVVTRARRQREDRSSSSSRRRCRTSDEPRKQRPMRERMESRL